MALRIKQLTCPALKKLKNDLLKKNKFLTQTGLHRQQCISVDIAYEK